MLLIGDFSFLHQRFQEARPKGDAKSNARCGNVDFFFDNFGTDFFFSKILLVSFFFQKGTNFSKIRTVMIVHSEDIQTPTVKIKPVANRRTFVYRKSVTIFSPIVD